MFKFRIINSECDAWLDVASASRATVEEFKAEVPSEAARSLKKLSVVRTPISPAVRRRLFNCNRKGFLYNEVAKTTRGLAPLEK